ncbi:MAG: nucleotidyltransferase [Candidatus Bathyarchaeia archaeon]
MPGTSRALRKLTNALDKLSIQHMLIGGFALAAYGQIRATQDVDLAIAASYEKSIELQGRLQKLGYQLAPEPHPDAALFFVTDLKEMLEVEMWTKPDGVVFDRETLRRRVKVRPFADRFEMFAIGPEDFIVNKLARRDRGVQDEQDAVSVLAMQQGRLDYSYLRKRAKQADVTELLETLMQASNTRP